MALETRGPMKDEVLPIMEKREKNRNSLPRGVTSDICRCLSEYQGCCERAGEGGGGRIPLFVSSCTTDRRKVRRMFDTPILPIHGGNRTSESICQSYPNHLWIR